MRRRSFLKLAGAAAAFPGAAFAQSAPMKRLGFISTLAVTDPQSARYLSAIHDALTMQGWVEGRNLTVDRRWSSSSVGDACTNAQELISLRPDAVLAMGTDNAVALASMTRAIPIVFSLVADASRAGLVGNPARPSANVTGFTDVDSVIGETWVQLLGQLNPRVKEIWFLYDPASPAGGALFGALEVAARRLGIQTRQIAASDPEDITSAVNIVATGAAVGLVVANDEVFLRNRKQLVGEVAQLRVLAVWGHVLFATEGGIVTYAVDPYMEVGRAAEYVGRILGGAAIADLPVEAPAFHTLSVNLKAARAQGFDIPQTILAIADQVIE